MNHSRIAGRMHGTRHGNYDHGYTLRAEWWQSEATPAWLDAMAKMRCT